MKRRLQRITASMLAATMLISTPFTILAESNGKEPASESNMDTVYVGMIKEGVRENNFNKDWSFYYVDGTEPEGVSTKDFNDATWRKLNLPHDYSIEQDFTVLGEAESGFLLGGVGWYRKHFTVSEKFKNKDFTLNFDGSYMNTDVYVNGHKVGTNNYGYTPFAFDISEYLVCDGTTDNVIAVRVNNPIPTSRWYSGSGIYRDVTLSVTDKVHVGYEGTFVTTPKLEAQKAGDTDVSIKVEVENETKEAKTAVVRNTVMLNGVAKSAPVEKSITLEPGTLKEVATTAVVNKPSLWSVDTPTIYQVKTEVLVDNKVVDTYETDFGFRYYSFQKDTGFSLNGEKIKLKGVCMHHDQGALGAVANERATRRQMEKLKEMGCNAVRVTHNPASSALLKACNELGLLVINEAFDGWSQPKNGNTNDFSKYFKTPIGADNEILTGEPTMTWAEFVAKIMVKSSKNDPSIIMWSIGNEVFEGVSGNTSDYTQIAKDIMGWIEEEDTTRPLTVGENKINASDGRSVALWGAVAEKNGIVGVNYPGSKGANYDVLRNRYQSYTIYGSETSSALRSRGYYKVKGQDGNDLQASAYDTHKTGWGDYANDAWYGAVTRDFISGDFVWTGFDYIGEPTNWNGTSTGSVSGKGAIPKSSFFGIIDTAGFEKDTFYLYQSMWNEKLNTLHILPSWNEADIPISNGNVDVQVYTDAAKVELLLNGKVVGTQTFKKHTTGAGFSYQTAGDSTNQFARFNIKYEPGTLTAKAYDASGKEITETVGRKEIKTSEAEAKLALTADRKTITADGEDLSYITVDVLDGKGNPVYGSAKQLQFELSGNGKIVGLDNGNPADADSYKPTTETKGARKAFSGKALVIVQSTDTAGSITLTAKGEGIETQTITIKSEYDKAETKKEVDSYQIKKEQYVGVNGTVELAKTVKVTYSDRSTAELPVVWESIKDTNLQKPGIFPVYGTISGEEVKVAINVHVIGDLLGFENYSCFTYATSKPNLPSTLKGHYKDGSRSEALPVIWDDIKPEQIAEVGNTVVKGKISILGKDYPVTASVRVVEKLPERVNLALATTGNPTLTQSCSNPADNLKSINDGSTNGSATTGRWTNWNHKGEHASDYVQLEWDKEYYVGTMDLYLYADSVTPVPKEIKIYYKDANGQYKLAPCTYITIVSYNQGVTPLSLITPVTTSGIRVELVQKEAGKAVGLTEVEVFESIMETKPNKTANLTDLKLNGKTIEGFHKDTKEYTIEDNTDAKITAVASDNAAVTVLPVANKRAKIIVTSEDQLVTNTYTITFKGDEVGGKEGFVTENGKTYYVNQDGKKASGWKQINGKYYYFNTTDQSMATGWVQDGGLWYHMNKDGIMETGWVLVGGTWYYLNASGAMATGWMQDGATWYYLNASGAMQTGWVQDGGTWYYLNASGAMQTGWVAVGGTWYYLNASGVMQTGWIVVGGTWYYLNGSGAMQTGWFFDGIDWYYLGHNGAMATGWVVVNGKYYHFNSSGRMSKSTWVGNYWVNHNGE